MVCALARLGVPVVRCLPGRPHRREGGLRTDMGREGIAAHGGPSTTSPKSAEIGASRPDASRIVWEPPGSLAGLWTASKPSHASSS